MAESPTPTLTLPGPSWRLKWPTGGLNNLQLDVVGFLAILGEDGVKKTSRLASLSWTFCLPRLLPAPHCLLFSERPEEHDVFRAKVAGVLSGNFRDHLTHVAGALFGPMQSFTVRCCEISEKAHQAGDGRSSSSNLRATWKGPVVVVNLVGCALSIALLVLSFVFGDGMSLVATLLLSTLSTLVGFTNHWQFSLQRRRSPGPVPSGDTIIYWPNGSMLVVKCSEETARELFWAPESINYTLTWNGGFMFLSLCGTIFLMVSVIALANATIEMQLAWASAYVLLNIGHWVAAALPRKYSWDFSAFEIKEQSNEDGPFNKNFTEALFKAIVFTKSVRWVKQAELAPATDVWDVWLDKAEEKSHTVGSHTGPLVSPIWAGDDPSKGTVWEWPADVDPREMWIRIMEAHRASEERKRNAQAV